MSFLTEFGVDAAAVHRLTKLITDDVICDAPRETICRFAYGAWLEMDQPPEGYDSFTELALDKPHHAPKLAVLVTCRWCASIWISAGVLLARRISPRWWPRAGRLLALSSAGTLTAGLER